ncbi:hypothetical protein R8510_04727 [Ralstonia chuxiongensis]|nr:hypothetical protein R8510_04727 [Ralstonia chuxiongensis]
MPGTKIAAYTCKKRGRKPLDPNPPREVVRHQLPEFGRSWTNDGHALIEQRTLSDEVARTCADLIIFDLDIDTAQALQPHDDEPLNLPSHPAIAPL